MRAPPAGSRREFHALPAGSGPRLPAYDDTLVFVEHFTAELTITQPHEVHSCLRRFATFAKCVVYGAEARAVVRRAPDDLFGE